MVVLETYFWGDVFSSSAIPPAILTALGVLWLYYVLSRQTFSSSSAPKPRDDDWPIVGSLKFFTARWDFFNHTRGQYRTKCFSFHLGRHPVVGLMGDEARQTFYETKALSLSEGYAVLFGQNPGPRPRDDKYLVYDLASTDECAPSEPDFERWFANRITKILSGDNLAQSLSKITSDTRSALAALSCGDQRTTDPFDSLYSIVFRITVRTSASTSIADSPQLLAKTLSYYDLVERSTAPASSIVAPWWLPTPSRLKCIYGGLRLFLLIRNVVEERKRGRRREKDALQVLIDGGDGASKIVAFVIASLYAGLLNSGINAAYILCYLTTSPTWMEKAREEVEAVADKYGEDPSATLEERLSHLPITAWEFDFPVLDLCLKDTIRINSLGALFRRNRSAQDVPIGDTGEVIPPRTFATYHIADIHYDPEVYPNPGEWDPGRYLPERAEEKKKPLAWVGFGAGRHPCPGMRLAKVEINIITALFLAKFDNLTLHDGAGNKLDRVPPPNRNMIAPEKPKMGLFLKYEPRHGD